jgi:hypothetical protein
MLLLGQIVLEIQVTLSGILDYMSLQFLHVVFFPHVTPEVPASRQRPIITNNHSLMLSIHPIMMTRETLHLQVFFLATIIIWQPLVFV